MTNEQFNALVAQDAQRLIAQGVVLWERDEELREKLTYDYGTVDSAGIFHAFEDNEEWSEFDD
jgi:hypothetical protein